MKFEVHGRTGADATTIVLSAGLGGLGHFWGPQIPALSREHRVIIYDHRGTGSNAETLPAGYSIAMMADDVIEIIDIAGADSVAFIGHALGALVGLDLASRYSTRIEAMVAVNGWARVSSHTRRCFDARRELLLKSGVEAYVKAQPIFLYPSVWIEAHADRMARDDAAGVKHFQGVDNLLKRLGALVQYDATAGLGTITQPTLVAASRDDVLVPWTCSQALADRLPNGELWMVPEGGHGFTVVEPDVFNNKVLSFLRTTTRRPR
jgi:aminoacrylate hydrolase